MSQLPLPSSPTQCYILVGDDVGPSVLRPPLALRFCLGNTVLHISCTPSSSLARFILLVFASHRPQSFNIYFRCPDMLSRLSNLCHFAKRHEKVSKLWIRAAVSRKEVSLHHYRTCCDYRGAYNVLTILDQASWNRNGTSTRMGCWCRTRNR